MICLDCGDNDIRYDDKEKSYHCNNCGSRHLGSRSKGCGIRNCLSCANSFEPCMKNNGKIKQNKLTYKMDFTEKELEQIKYALEYLHDADLSNFGDDNIESLESVMKKLEINYCSQL